ncbi:hypothetical protein Nmel_005388, partial [Mimus melanotis]
GGRAGEAAPAAPRSRSAPLAELFLREDEGGGPAWQGCFGCAGRLPLPHALGLWPQTHPGLGCPLGQEVIPPAEERNTEPCFSQLAVPQHFAELQVAPLPLPGVSVEGPWKKLRRKKRTRPIIKGFTVFL